MSLPIFVVAMILQVTGIWNDFLFGVIYTKPDTYPMTVQLNNIVNSVQGVKEYNVNMAATLLTGLVPLVIYFASGKLFVRGIAAGAALASPNSCLERLDLSCCAIGGTSRHQARTEGFKEIFGGLESSNRTLRALSLMVRKSLSRLD